MAFPAFEDCPPDAPYVTDYDERHHRTYWRLLDAAAENANWREVVTVIFGIDPDADSARAKAVYESHLARARWMSETGYRRYLESRTP